MESIPHKIVEELILKGGQHGEKMVAKRSNLSNLSKEFL
jgi:hypothetical protein